MCVKCFNFCEGQEIGKDLVNSWMGGPRLRANVWMAEQTMIPQLLDESEIIRNARNIGTDH